MVCMTQGYLSFLENYVDKGATGYKLQEMYHCTFLATGHSSFEVDVSCVGNFSSPLYFTLKFSTLQMPHSLYNLPLGWEGEGDGREKRWGGG